MSQKKDISMVNIRLRLNYRDKLLDKLLPHMYRILAKKEEKKPSLDLNIFKDEVFKVAVKNYVRSELAKKLRPELFNEVINALEIY
jgi:hypothetical protein